MSRWLLAALAVIASSASAAAEEVVTIPVRDGVTESFLLVHNNAAPSVVFVSFVGAEGAVNLARRAQQGPLRFGPAANFLVRVREELAGTDMADAIVDAPSDQLPGGMSDAFRASEAHAADLRKIIADLNAKFPGARVFLLGTSRGTISAANVGVRLGNVVQGVILTSTVTVADRTGPGLSGFDFSSLKQPVLWVHNRGDQCRSSPYAAAERAAHGAPLVSVQGGNPPQSGPCDALSPHGYFGREQPTVQAIRNYVLGRDFARDISLSTPDAAERRASARLS